MRCKLYADSGVEKLCTRHSIRLDRLIDLVLERLRQNPKLDMVYLCLDNDDAGNDACDRMTDTLEDMGLDVERLCPVRKDWNDDLCAKFERKEKDT